MKRVIVCCDGTWNRPETFKHGKQLKTNVQKVFEGLSDKGETKQVKFYGSGVGTGFTVKDNLFGGAFGKGIDENIQDAYKFIMWNYEKGDQLFLFGFSRGAYTVRSLAGFIRNCGVMEARYLHLVNEAYHLYRSRTALTHPDSDLMKAYRKNYSVEDEVPIHFVGIWDTVGALGIPLSSFNWFNKKYHFHDVKLSTTIKHAYHALAVDEKRKIFEPALWEVKEGNSGQICEQVWFPGVHSNVGGGYEDAGLSDIALKWMAEKAANKGLEFKKELISSINTNCCGKLVNSSSGLFFFTPQKQRDINRGYVLKKNPDTGEMEKVKAITNERVHYTCFERCNKNKEYSPLNFYKAVESEIPYDPNREEWIEGWAPFLENYRNIKKRSIFSIFNWL